MKSKKNRNLKTTSKKKPEWQSPKIVFLDDKKLSAEDEIHNVYAHLGGGAGGVLFYGGTGGHLPEPWTTETECGAPGP